jgi:hydroquinone 1,2-dioxygenase large subunit-like protein
MSSSFAVQASEPDNYYGYRRFRKGKFEFHRDEYFVHIRWPKGSHTMAADAFLRALQRDIAWNFFYGTVNFDSVFGTLNHYGTVDMFAGRFNDTYRTAGIDYNETYKSEDLMATFKAMLDDWTNRGYDPFAAPQETKQPYGRKDGDNKKAIERLRITAKRMVGLPDDTPVRSDANGYAVNRHFADVPQDQPDVHAEPGFESEVSAFNLFAYLSRSDVTWNPSVCSVVKESLYCPTSEEFILPVEHGNDRVEWFMQLSDEIIWDVKDKETGAPRARVIARAGDICAMPADIRHQGYSPKRSMLLVWENNSSAIPELIISGKAPVVPVKF